MKTKLICIVFILVLALNLSACDNSQENMNSSRNESVSVLQSVQDNSSENTENQSGDNHTVNAQNSDTDKNITEVGSIDNAAFSGKVVGCYYADNNMVIIAADKLYLYDTQKNESIASVDISLGGLNVQTYSDGYLVVGQENGSSNGSFMTSKSGGITGYLLNKDFEIENTISFQPLLSNDIVINSANIAISQDGKQIAYGGIRGLYLYNTADGEFSTILNYSEDGVVNNIKIAAIDSLAFTGEDTLIYAGTGTNSSNDGDGFSIYGTVSIDSTKLSVTRKADYKIEEIQKGGDILIMPQSFDKNNGTLLTLDTTSDTEKTMNFSSISEGKDGVFCSRQGKYVATSTLEDSSVTINIYDTASGKVIYTETVKDNNDIYFLRIPRILILDESNTCIVVLGGSVNDVNTLITTFGFEE